MPSFLLEGLHKKFAQRTSALKGSIATMTEISFSVVSDTHCVKIKSCLSRSFNTPAFSVNIDNLIPNFVIGMVN